MDDEVRIEDSLSPMQHLRTNGWTWILHYLSGFLLHAYSVQDLDQFNLELIALENVVKEIYLGKRAPARNISNTTIWSSHEARWLI